MLKKILICTLTLALLLSFCGCSLIDQLLGSDDIDDFVFDGEVVDDLPAATLPTVTDTTEPQKEIETPAESETEETFGIGSTTENTYRNEFIGIQCTLNLDWTFMSDAEIRTQNEATLGVMGDDYASALANASLIYDMMAYHSNATDTLGVVLEKLSGTNLLISEEQYLTASMNSAVGSLQSMGISVTAAEIVKVQFAGAEHYALTIEGNYAGFAIYECLVVVKCDGYIAAITACTWDTNTCMEILDRFQPYTN